VVLLTVLGYGDGGCFHQELEIVPGVAVGDMLALQSIQVVFDDAGEPLLGVSVLATA
jgi:hypothetical protein